MNGKSGTKIFCLCLFIVFFWGFYGAGVQAADYYVDKTAGSDSYAGTSWSQAKATIQAAINLATVAGDRVLVAAGTYNERVTFPSHSNFQLLGGFPSGGGSQDPRSNPTIIDGTGLTGSVVSIPGNIGTSVGYTALVLDGFTIQNGTKSSYYGTGIESWSVDLTIKRCLVQNNTNTGGMVGGIYVGALLNESSARTLRIEQSIIRNNTGPYGGGIVVDSIGYPSIEMTNVLVYGNHASSTGSLYSVGGVTIGTGGQDVYSCKITNCTIADNTSAHPGNPVGGIAVNLDNYSGVVRIVNSIIWNGPNDILDYTGNGLNVTLSYSDISDAGDTGTGVIHTNPAFVGAGNYHLTSGSGGCIDGGTATGAPATDLEGTTRPQGAGFDMGAYEYVVSGFSLTASVIDGNGSVSPTSGTYPEGTVVALTATPNPGYRVAAWTGTDNDSLTGNDNTVTMDADKVVTVRFEIIPPVQYTLTTSVTGGHGTIAPPTGGFNGGTVVNLLATPDVGYRVASWTGTNTDASLFMNNQVTMDGDKSVSVSFAPIPYGDWTAEFGDVAGADGNDYARGIAFDHNGQVLAVGEIYTGFGTNLNGYDAYGVRYDATGAQVTGKWPVIFHSTAYHQKSRFHSATVDSQNNVLLAGEDMESDFYYQRFSLWKYAEDGTLLWQKTYRSDAWNYAKDVCVDSKNIIFVVGETFTHWSEPYWDWRIERWTPAGDSSIRFNVDIGTNESFYVQDYAEAVVCGGDDNIVVVGKKAMSSHSDFTYADEDWHIRKYPNNLDNDAGIAGYQPIWEFTYRPSGLSNNGALRDTAMDVAEDSAGNVYVVGYISQGTDNTGANRDIRGQIIKLSKDGDGAGTGTMIGTPVFYGKDRQSAAMAVAVDDQDKVYVGGWVYNSSNELFWCLETYDTNLNLVDTQEWSDLKGAIMDIATQGGKVALTGYFDNRAEGAATADNDWKVIVLGAAQEEEFPWSTFLPAILHNKSK